MSSKSTPPEPTQPTDLPIFAQRPRPSSRSLGGSTPTAPRNSAFPPPPPAPYVSGGQASSHTGDLAHEAPESTAPRSTLPASQPPPPIEVTTSRRERREREREREPEGSRQDQIRDALDRLKAVDWAAVQHLRSQVSAALTLVSEDTALDESRHRTTVTRLTTQALDDWTQDRIARGEGVVSLDTQAALRGAVLDSMFGAGRLQPLLDLPGIENIEIEGHDGVTLEFSDGSLETGPPVADSDADLITEIQHIARTSTTGERQFSMVRPWLRLALPDGSRMAAEAWLSHRPSITIRKHPYIDTDLAQMKELGAIDDSLHAFLSAAIRAGKNVMVSGDAGAGKTTLVRALLNELDPRERLATIEAQYELLMHRLPERHHRVWAAEAQGGGEVGADGRPVGEVTLTRLIELSLQKNVTRIVVGEVVGEEVMAMMEAMQGGRGSISTVHAHSALDTVERLVTLITRARGNVDTSFGYRLVAQNVDLVVHVGLVDESHLDGGRKWRHVDEVVALEVSRDTHVAHTRIFTPDEFGRACPTGQLPDWISDVERHGFDAGWLDPAASTWGPPPELLIRHRGT
ncbi:CpaF family protein [Janibacter limosus]|uniref:CpaF family protein n=1 Tax=Janibacter limosus TaxID=53458 RepID=UPI00082BF12E|nr:ATPase, T2SS/T4P/T4SS family [Janibacter limosus]